MAFWTVTAILACAFLPTGTAVGQDLTHRFEVFAEGGASFSNKQTLQITVSAGSPPQLLTTTDNRALLTTGRLFAGIRLWLDEHQAIEASYSYSPSDVTARDSCSPNCGFAFSTSPLRAHFIAGNYVHRLFPRRRIRPFLTAGLGGVFFHELFFQEFTGAEFAANFGGGFDCQLSPRWAVRTEYRDWIFQLPRQDHFTPGGLTHNQVPSVGLVFRF